MVVSNIYFHPHLGKISNLTSIFFGWVETTNQFRIIFTPKQIEKVLPLSFLRMFVPFLGGTNHPPNWIVNYGDFLDLLGGWAPRTWKGG